MPWQTMVSAIFSVIGLVLIGAALFMQAEGIHAEKSANTPLAHGEGIWNQASLPESDLAEPRLPTEESHLQDLKRLFELARSSGVRIGQIDHAWMAGPERNLRLHMMTLRLSEPYPDLRLLLRGIAETIPHASIHDLRIERRNAEAIEVDATLQLLMLYRSAAESSNAD